MKRLLLGALFALISGGTSVLSQDRPLPRDSHEHMLAGFDITVARSSNGVSLTCERGCAWKELKHPLGPKPTPLNENGLAGDNTDNPATSGAFLIRIDTDKKGFVLSCERGCAWRTLGWTFPSNGSAVRINEYGTVPNRKAS